MAKKLNLAAIIAWIVGIIVSLGVGFAFISGTLVVPFIGIVNVVAGWIVVIGTVLGVLMQFTK